MGTVTPADLSLFDGVGVNDGGDSGAGGGDTGGSVTLPG